MRNRQVMQFHNESFCLEYVVEKENPWFKGKEIASMLGYLGTAKAVRIHIDDEGKRKFEKYLSFKTLATLYGQPVWMNDALKTYL